MALELNELDAKYVVIGGWAIIHTGQPRFTADIDLIISVDLENEAKAYEVLRSLPDRAVDELEPGDVAKYAVVRVNDGFTIDLMKSAGGIEYEEAAKDVVIREIDGVAIPFASPSLLWKMKFDSQRPKDQADLVFLRQWFEHHGVEIPKK